MAVVGVMYNLKGAPPEEGEPPDLGAELDSESTVAAVALALRAHGHEVQLIEGNDTAYLKLLSNRLDIVFNMCEGLRGESRESHIPSMLEMLGIPYTGSGVLTLALTLDKPLAKKVLAYHGIPTPGFRVFSSPDEISVEGLEFPLFVKPAHEGSSMGVSSSSYCRDIHELTAEARRLIALYRQPVLVEEYLPGREFTVGILGNKNPIIFPVMEINFDAIPAGCARVYSRQFKTDWSDDIYYMCPAPISPELEALLKDTALKTYRALDCRDLARVDLRLDRNWVPNVMEVNPLPGLAPGYSDYPRIAEKGGWSFTDLVNGILECALRRNKMEHLIKPPFVKQIA
ncbi:MAG: D-alanine--D-alanine ligase family protein [Bacillota bacterium]|jgi:D-alanine-D-alanine ligase